MDASLCCVAIRGARSERFGLPPSLIGKYFPDLLAPSEAPVIVEVLHGVVENCIGAVITASFAHGGGGTRWLTLNVTPVDPGLGDRASIVIEIDDAAVEDSARRDATASPEERSPTDRRVAVDDSIVGNESKPRAQSGDEDDRFRTIVENLRDSVCELDEEGRILYASPSYAESFGERPEDLVGADPLATAHPQDRRRVAQLFRPGARARRRGTLVYRAQTRNGAWVKLEATAREFAGPDGRRRVVVAMRDVTERENSRAALERHIELETRVAELSRFFIDVEIDAIHAGIESRLAVVATLADAQHSRMCAFATGRDGMEIFDWWRDPRDVREPPPAIEATTRFPYSTAIVQSGRVYHVADVDALPAEAANEREDMLTRGIRSILGIPIMSNGRFVGFLGFENFEREINWPEETIMLLRIVGEIFYSALRRRRAAMDLRLSQNQLLQSQKMEAVGTLAGGIAHDFNNHLAVMLGNARFLRQEVDSDPDVTAAIEDIERSADHCAQLTRSLLTFSRRSPVQVLAVEVAELVDGVVGLVRPLLPSAVEFETSLMPDLGSFRVDRVQIQQVLVNLLVNARDAMAEGGRIRLEGRRRRLVEAETQIEGLDPTREYVVLSIEDTGHGMNAETRSRIFEPFFTTKSVGHGTGLGLAMAYGIVRQSEGAIDVESRLGVGSTFRVYLPSSMG